jgi:hypothetical protein
MTVLARGVKLKVEEADASTGCSVERVKLGDLSLEVCSRKRERQGAAWEAGVAILVR